MRKKFKLGILAWFFMSGAYAAPYSLLDATQEALAHNPDIQAKRHILNSALDERRMVKGNLFPQIGLSGSWGRDTSDRPDEELATTRSGVGLSLTQMLFDGFKTHNELKKLSYAELTRYYELLDAAENISLETARAFYDVLRYRKQLKMAEDNYVQHRAVYEQLQQRVKSGVSRRVDLEQASGRLALASANLLTEQSNLHDVSARFQRVVGILPPSDLAEPPLLDQRYPQTLADAMAAGHASNPALLAANANLAAARADESASKSSRWPTVDLRASSRAAHNEGFVDGHRSDNTVELVVNYKLFSGGTDNAKTRMMVQRKYLAEDMRLKACRDMRQTTLIAYFDVQQRKQQLAYLDEHQLSIGKAREAYRQQFNIGQRSLLDLLDSENEYFESRRAYAAAQYDLAFAYLRTQAAAGQLLQAQGLQAPEDRPRHEDDPELNVQCPAENLALPTTDMSELNARALALADSRQPTVVATPVAPVEVKPAPAPLKTIDIKADGLFEINQPQLLPEGLKRLDDAILASGFTIEQLAQSKDLKIVVVGHTDRTGNPGKNRKLSADRAESTRNYLIKKGFPAERISAEGRGSVEPKTGPQCLKLKGPAKSKERAACYSPDRRVELRIYSTL